MPHSRIARSTAALALILSVLACGFSATTANFTEAFLAADEAGTQPTTEFFPEDTIFLILELANAPNDTNVKAVWVAVDADGVDFDTVIDEAELETNDGRLTFDLANEDLWPVGNYKVDVYINDVVDRTLEFAVAE